MCGPNRKGIQSNLDAVRTNDTIPLKKWRSNYQGIIWYGTIHRHGEELNLFKAM